MTPTQVTSYIKILSYDKLYQKFQRPNDALGYRHHNPIARFFDKFSLLCQMIIRPLFRIEIIVRLKPE
jgi:hypothetical protein